MKKRFFLGFLGLLLLVGNASADWEITASWTASTGPDLAYEELWVGDSESPKATIHAGDNTAHTWIMERLNGETVKVKSYNTAGVPNEYIIGTLEEIAPPASATGGSLIIKWK